MGVNNHKIKYSEEDILKDSLYHLIIHRLPWLFLGLLGGIFVTIVISKYEAILSSDVRLVFFIPIIVYLSSAVGTQTETIFVRELTESRIKLVKYMAKEILIGAGLGIVFGILLGTFTFLWLKSPEITLTIGMSTFINLSIAPILAVLVPNILYKEHSDPALGAGPVATIIQDLISLLVYFFIATAIIF